MNVERKIRHGGQLLAFVAASSLLCGQEPARPPAVTIFFPLREVHAGLRGTGYTVFQGTEPEAFNVEILGVLRNSLGAGRDMILARLHGPKPEYTGVVAGMSGSPVYIDGRLVGALSYRIGQFSKDPIAGITPIEQMLEVRDQPAREVATQPKPMRGDQPEVRAIESPLTFSGFSHEAIDRFGDRFRALGMVPVAGLGGMDAGKKQPEPLLPGSAVSAVLAEGDLSITGTCTVSYVDSARLLACGHPITQFGPVDMPMAKAEVVATLASPLNSFKIVNATEVAGAFTEDRASAILGRFDAHAAMIPMTIHLQQEGSSGQPRAVRLRVLNNPQLTPQVMLVSLFQALQQSETGAAETSYHLRGEIVVDSAAAGVSATAGSAQPPVHLDSWVVPSDFSPAAVSAALLLGADVEQVYASSGERATIRSVVLDVESSQHRREFVLENARLSRPELRPGEAVTIEASVRPFRESTRTVQVQVTLPASLQPGSLRLLVSDGATLDRLQGLAGAHAHSLSDAVERLNSMHPNDRLYVTLLDRTAQAALESISLTGFPLSMANVLEPLKETQRVRLTGESVVELGSIALDGAVTGSTVLPLTIR